MFSDIKKSIGSILYERLTSPLHGTFIISWLLWNWKIPYVTFFENTDKLNSTKIEYITNMPFDIKPLLVYPIISTAFFILLVPFLSNGAYWVSLMFENWKRDKKNKIEKNQLLTIEQSIEIRNELKKQDENFARIFEDKDHEIATLKTTIETMRDSKQPTPILSNLAQPQTDDEKYKADYEKISSKDLFKNSIRDIAACINNKWSFSGNVENDSVSFAFANKIIETNDATGNNQFTDRGKYYLKQYLNSLS